MAGTKPGLLSKKAHTHSRKSAPKVRTGCLTCKTRHLKCGEEKPVCLRCRTDEFKCDGYLPIVTNAPPRIKTKTWPCTVQLPLRVDCSISGSTLEKYFLHHVREVLIKDLACSVTGAKFWQHLVLPAAHHDDSVKHALVALGMAHGSFVGGTLATQHDNLILQQYNSAISVLTPKMSEINLADLSFTLMCCLIFFCLENVMGNYAQSLHHLRAGSRLLASHSDSIRSSMYGQSSQRADDLREIADMFSTLGVDASFFMDEPVVSALNMCSKATVEHMDTTLPFKDLADARNLLNAITVEFNAVVEGFRSNWYAPEMLVIYDKFRRWANRFDITIFHLQGASPSQAEQRELMGLKLSRLVWLTLLECGPSYPKASTAFDQTFSEALDQAEEILLSFRSRPYPLFTLEGDIVPAIAAMCDITSNRDIQRRAIDLLRSAQRREGVWDSGEVAEYLEDYLLGKEMLELNWENVPGGLPGSVKLLSGLNLSTIGPCNGILRLANEGAPWKLSPLCTGAEKNGERTVDEQISEDDYGQALTLNQMMRLDVS